MTYLHRLFGSKSARQAKPFEQKPRNLHRLNIEQLEARITPADVTVASLLFRGDLVADGALWKATGKPIEVGFNPAGTEAFKSLVTLTGDTVIDPVLQNFQFKGTGALPGVSGLQDFWSSTTLSTFDVQKMTATTGESITGKSLTLGDLVSTATTLTLENPNGGDTSDSQVKLDGAGTLAFTGASTPLAINPLTLTVTGTGAGSAMGKASGPFQAQGTTWTLTENPLAATITGGKSTVTITGTASAVLRTDTVSMLMDTTKDAANGLVIEAGALKTLGASVTAQAFTIAGTPITLDGRFSLTNTALDFKGTAQHTGALTFLGYSDFRFSVENAKLSALTAYATAPWLNGASAGAGIAFSFLPFKGVVSLTANMESKLTSDPSGNESLSITGSAGFTWDKLSDGKSASKNAVAFTVTAAGNGWVIKDGVVQDWDIQVDGRLDIMSQSFEARATRLWYSANDPIYGKDTVGFSGSLYLTLGGGRTFKDDKGNLIASEPANFFELNCGTKQSPGFIFSNGEVRRVDVAVSVKQMKAGKPVDKVGLKWKGLEFRVTQAGIYYDANEGTTSKKFGFYGILGTELGLKKGSFSGGQIGASFGTRANPGFLISSDWDEKTQAWISNFDVRDITLRFTNFKIGKYGLNNLEISYQVPDKTKPEVGFWAGKAEISFGDFYGGLSLKFKTIVDNQTGASSEYFDGGSVSIGVDPTGDSDGIRIPNPWNAPVFIVRAEVGVENWTDPNNWALFGTGVIGFGNRLPYFDSSSKDMRKVYPTVVRGTIRLYPSSWKVTGTVDVFVAAYWDKMANASFTEGWKALVGSGKGSFVIDVPNNNYTVDFTGNLLQLVNGTFQFVLKNGELLLYANVQLKPTPYGIWDFWPVNKIDVSGTALLILSERQKLFAGWTQIKIIGVNQTLGLGYDFLKGEAIWVTSAGKVGELIKLKDAFLNQTADFKYTQVYQAKADQASTPLQASRFTVSIPFVTAKVAISGTTYASPLTTSDIQVTVPTVAANGVNSLPAGASYNYRVEMGQPNGQYTVGSIIVDIFPNTGKKTDFTKTFASLGIDKLMVDIKVGLKQNSMFFLPGPTEADCKPYVDTILADPTAYLNGIDPSQAGSAQYAKAVWDSTKEVSVGGNKYPLAPAQSDNFMVTGPTIDVANGTLVSSEINSYTNTAQFTYTANASTQTLNNGTVSLLVAEEADIAASRWTVQRTGEWSSEVAGNTGYSYSADAWVVEKNSFDTFDIKNQKVETPFAGTVGTEVLFFNTDKIAQVGVVQSVGTSVTILSGGANFTVAPDQVKALWARKAQVKLLSKTGGGSAGEVFTATLIPTGFAQKQQLQDATSKAYNYYEAFSADQAVTLGQMPALPAGPITATMLKLPTLPGYVGEMEAAEGSVNGSKYYPVDAGAKLTTLRLGSAPSLANSDGTVRDATANFPLKDLQGGTGTVTWSEQGMTPTPKWAYLQINDNINPAAFSGFYRFTPSVQLTGKALVTDNISPAVPYQGLTVYLDTNNNGVFDRPEAFKDANNNGVFDAGETYSDTNNNGVRDTLQEPYTLTNSAGEYYFFDVAQGSHQIGFDLPDNRLPVSGTSLVTVTRGSEAVTTVPDFNAKYSNPTLAGQLFVDTNQNNKRDADERGAAGAKLLVLDKGGKAITTPDGQPLVVVTDDEGNYSITLWEEYGTEVQLKLEGTADGGKTTIGPTKDGGDTKLFTGVDYAKPAAFTHDFAVQASYEFKPDPNASTIENVFGYLMLFLQGKYTGVNFRTSGFQFLVERFKMLPFEENQQGIENAKGKAIFGGQTLNFEFVGPRGLVTNGLKLLEVNLKLSGDFNIFGAKLNLNQLTGRFVAGDPAQGTSDRFQLTGATTLDIGGNKVTAELLNSGLVLSDQGIESLDLKFTGSLRIAGQDVDLGSLKAVYDRVADKLTLSGDTKILTLGSETDGTFFRLKGALIEIAGGKVTTLQATIEGAMDIAGAKFSLDSLSFAYLASASTFRLTGSSTVDFSGDRFTVSLPEPGAEFSDAGTRIKGKVTGSANLGTKASPVTLSLDNLDLDYSEADSSLRIAGKTSLTVNKTQVGLAQGDLRFKGGQFQSFKASASGEFTVGGAVVTLGAGNKFEYDRATDLLRLAGDATVSLAPAAGATGENAKKTKLVGISGSITLKDGAVEAITATVSTGTLAIANAPVQLQSMGFAYDGVADRYALSGSATIELLGGKLTAAFPAPGIVWKNGQFDSLSFKLSGELPLQKDKAGKAAIALKAEDLAAAYSDSAGSLTLTGGASIRAGNTFGKLETDANGIVIADNELKNFSAFLTLNLGFGGEAFTDSNQNLKWDTGEPFTDANGNKKYDGGLSLDVTKAGVSYAAATADSGTRLLLAGKAVLDFDGTGPGKEGVTIEMANPGIELIDGEVENFSAAVTTAFDLKSLNFKPSGAAGLRYQRAKAQLDLFGGVNIKVGTNEFGFTLGTSLDNPGLRLENGAITYVSAALTTSFGVGDLTFKATNAGFTYNGAKDAWALFGGVKLSNVFSVGLSLGTQADPGLLIRNNDWEINNVTFELEKISLGSFGIEEARLTINKSDTAWSVYAKCAVQLPIAGGVGASGEFSVVNGNIDLISVALASQTGINIPGTPLLINYISGSIKNLTNLDQIILSGSMGIGVGSQIDILGKKATIAQFVGSFTLDPNSLRLQVDAYLGAINSGTLTAPKWSGVLGKGTGTLLLDWGKGEYYADVKLSLLGGTFEAGGRLSFSDANGLVMRAYAALKVPDDIKWIGGKKLGAADFLLVANPAKDQMFVMGWGTFDVWVKSWTYGIKVDFSKPSVNFDLLEEADINRELKNANVQPTAFSSMALMDTPVLRSASVLASPMGPRVLGGFNTQSSQAFEYAGQSSAVPPTEVTTGLYQARFRVKDPARWADSASWLNQVTFLAEPVPGVEFVPMPAEFDPNTGYGSIGLRAVPLAGQYLPRGLGVRSKLRSPVELGGIYAETSQQDPDLETAWEQAFAYQGITPAVGSDQDGNPGPAGLRVTEAVYTIQFRPVAVDSQTDWLESLRLYLDPVDGVRFQVGDPQFNPVTGSASLTFVATSTSGGFLPLGLQFGGVLRSKVELVAATGADGTTAPLISCAWNTQPPLINPLANPGTIDAGIQVTRLSGRVNDPRLKEVLVSLAYATDARGDTAYLVPQTGDAGFADSIPVPVQPDGTWSIDISWDSTNLPHGKLWMLGGVRAGEMATEVRSLAAGPFQVRRDIEGTLRDTLGGYSGVPVFADLNDDGQWQPSEPRSITDQSGRYALHVPGHPARVPVVFAVPRTFMPVDGASARQIADLSRGPVTLDLGIRPTQNILRGSVFVTGDLQVDGYNDSLRQAVSGLGVLLTDANGRVLRVTTNNQGRYEVPVEVAGTYTLTMDFDGSSFLGNRLREMPGIATSQVLAFSSLEPRILTLEPVRVDSVGVVRTTEMGDQGSLDELIRQANTGFVSTIEFDTDLRGATIDVTLPEENPVQSYYTWDPDKNAFTRVEPPVVAEALYGPTAFLLQEDVRILGGDLGITLRQSGQGDGFRAFHVMPGVEAIIEGLTLQGFTATGSDGEAGSSGELAKSGGGGGAGLGGAILNRGALELRNVRLVGNTAAGGDGGAAWNGFVSDTELNGGAGNPHGQAGTSSRGGTGGGHLAGNGGNAFPVTLTYTLGDDPTVRTITGWAAAAGGGGSGLGGAIYNAPGARLTIGGGTSFTGNSASGGKGGAGSPEYFSNLANAFFGDSAHTVRVTGFEAWEQSQGTDGSGLGGAIFNDGGTVRLADSAFTGNTSTDAGAALYALKGSTVINTSAFRDNSSGQDLGIRFEGGNLNEGTLELNRSMVLAGVNEPKALVATGGRRLGEGNIVSSQTGFAWGVLATSFVARPDSPFTGKPYIPASNGAPVPLGAPVTFTTDTRVQAGPRQPFSITTTVSNPAGVGVPGGRVVLGLAGQPVGEGLLSVDGSVSVAAPGLKAGRYAFDVYYEGDSIFAGSLGKTSVTVGSPTERIVEELYETHLGRESDANGLKAWSARIDGGLSVEDAVRAFRSSTEASLKTVERVYQELLNRLPDQVGRDGWIRFLQTGKTERDLRAQVLASREYTGSHTQEEVINRLYETYLGREADQAGMANWLARWDAGINAGTIARAIGSSNEARELVVDELYQQVLGREADQVGRRVWAGALASGMSQDQVEGRLLTSSEFTGWDPRGEFAG